MASRCRGHIGVFFGGFTVRCGGVGCAPAVQVFSRITGEVVSSFIAHFGCPVLGPALSAGTIITCGEEDYCIRILDMTPWLISAVDCVDMFYLWRMIKGPTATIQRSQVSSLSSLSSVVIFVLPASRHPAPRPSYRTANLCWHPPPRALCSCRPRATSSRHACLAVSQTALENLIRHFRDSGTLAFVEHFLSLGVSISPENIVHLQRARAHESLCFYQFLDANGDGDITDTDIVERCVDCVCHRLFWLRVSIVTHLRMRRACVFAVSRCRCPERARCYVGSWARTRLPSTASAATSVPNSRPP